jgi:hypothetical protein
VVDAASMESQTQRIRTSLGKIKNIKTKATNIRDGANDIDKEADAPIDQRLTHPESTSLAIQREVAAALVAANLLAARPPEHETAVVAALLDMPDLFGSEIQVFFEEAYFQGFTADCAMRSWKSLPDERSLARDWLWSSKRSMRDRFRVSRARRRD